MNREFPACPDLHFAMVDVRDVAAAHLAVLTVPGARSERFLCGIEDHSLREIAGILARHYGPKAYPIPTGRLPGVLMLPFAIFDGTARLAPNDLGRPARIDNSRIRVKLGWKPRGLEEMTVAMADSLIAHGLVSAKGRARA